LVYPAYYNGPVSYFARLFREREIILEQYENYTKQTYRNRCVIMGPNGILTLSIPVVRNKGGKTLMKDICIDYDTPWNRVHWKSLVASYAGSPFFDYMKDELQGFYRNRYHYLIDLNRHLMEVILSLLGREIPVTLSDSFTPIPDEKNPGSFIHPKKDPGIFDTSFVPVVYHQVFADRMGFRAHLSILDLLFNEGPEAPAILMECL